MLALTVVAANELADAIAGRAARARSAASPRPQAPAPVVAAVEHGGAAPTRRAVLLEVRDLTVVGRRRSRAWSPASPSRCGPGRVLGLVGESGCGKTMTARSLLGLLPDGVSVTGGSILLAGPRAGRPAGEGAHAIRGREIAMISQEPMVALDPMFSRRATS